MVHVTAVDDATDTVYIAGTGSDDLAAISSVTCNATVATECKAAPNYVTIGSGPAGIAVDLPELVTQVTDAGVAMGVHVDGVPRRLPVP